MSSNPKNVNNTNKITPVNTTSHMLNSGGKSCKQDKGWAPLEKMVIPNRPAEKAPGYGGNKSTGAGLKK